MMGASFAFILPVLAIIDDYSNEDFTSNHEVCKVQAICDREKREREPNDKFVWVSLPILLLI